MPPHNENHSTTGKHIRAPAKSMRTTQLHARLSCHHSAANTTRSPIAVHHAVLPAIVTHRSSTSLSQHQAYLPVCTNNQAASAAIKFAECSSSVAQQSAGRRNSRTATRPENHSNAASQLAVRFITHTAGLDTTRPIAQHRRTVKSSQHSAMAKLTPATRAIHRTTSTTTPAQAKITRAHRPAIRPSGSTLQPAA